MLVYFCSTHFLKALIFVLLAHGWMDYVFTSNFVVVSIKMVDKLIVLFFHVGDRHVLQNLKSSIVFSIFKNGDIQVIFT